jgi:hypothetical protein
MCTRCNNVFDEGADILNGCPVCGWKKFLFVRSESDSSSIREVLAKKPDLKGESLQLIQKVSEKEGRPALSADKPPVQKKDDQKTSRRAAEFKEGVDLPTDPTTEKPTRGVWEVEELLSDREFERKVESIRIEEPGTYELNLPKLLEREELVMAVKEGTYMIDLSSAFRRSKK